MTDIAEQIAAVDAQLTLAGQRLKRYRASGDPDGIVVQEGVCNRLLAERRALMAQRDHEGEVLEAP